MNILGSIFSNPSKTTSDEKLKKEKETIAARLGASIADLAAFEASYKNFETKSYKKEIVSKKKSDTTASDNIIDRIVDELLDNCLIIEYNDGKITKKTLHADTKPVSLEEIMALPEEIRPELTGKYMKRDIDEPAYIELMNNLINFEETKNPGFYHRFRQGLDILDLDAITYEMLSCNKNAMSYWLEKIAESVNKDGFFKIPDTKIVKVPLTLLQLTRIDYESLHKTTLEIIDRWAQKAFELNDSKKYFLKTGTYSSKFDFRNAKVTDSKEIKEIGEYLLYIHYSALQMAQFDIHRRRPVVYGVSTTNEWVVRDFIEDKENNPCIYHGMPLRTEYRAFVDFDTKEVFGIHSYWDPNVMKDRFDNYSDNLSPDVLHDSVIYRTHENELMNKFESNKDIVLKHIKNIIDSNTELTGQWSVDIMQNGDEFYFIDMAVAEQSAFYKEEVPEEKRRLTAENWIPTISAKS